MISKLKKPLTHDNKINRQIRGRCPEAKFRAGTAAPVVISCARLQGSNYDVVNLTWAIEEVVVRGMVTSCGCFICSRWFPVFHRWLRMLVRSNPRYPHMIYSDQWYMHLTYTFRTKEESLHSTLSTSGKKKKQTRKLLRAHESNKLKSPVEDQILIGCVKWRWSAGEGDENIPVMHGGGEERIKELSARRNGDVVLILPSSKIRSNER